MNKSLQQKKNLKLISQLFPYARAKPTLVIILKKLYIFETHINHYTIQLLKGVKTHTNLLSLIPVPIVES